MLVVSTSGASEVTSTVSFVCADLHDRVHSHHLVQIDIHAALYVLLEAGQVELQPISAHRHLRKAVVAAGVGGGVATHAGRFVRERDFHIGQHGARGVGDPAEDTAAGALGRRQAWNRSGKAHNQRSQLDIRDGFDDGMEQILQISRGRFCFRSESACVHRKPCYNRARLEIPPPSVKRKSAFPACDQKCRFGNASRATAQILLKIGDVARLVGVSPSAIRGWESLGLTRPQRTESKYRLYTHEDVRLLKKARYLRKVRGLNAPAIVQMLKREGAIRPAVSNDTGAIGPRLRQLRTQRGVGLAEVAAAAGISVGFLSALERSQMSASVGTLRKLARYYRTNILDFFDPTESNTRWCARQAQGAGSRSRRAHGIAGLGQHSDGAAPVPHRAPGRQRRVVRPRRRRILFVLRGELKIALAGEEYHLKRGDSFYFESATPHHWKNPGRSETWLLWVNTPPTF